MDKFDMLNIVYEYLAQLMECEIADLSQEKITYSISSTAEPYLKIAICGKAVVISASPKLYHKAVALLQNKSRDELFECPLVYGQTIHYIPDTTHIEISVLPPDFSYSLLQGEDVYQLSHITDFDNALVFDSNRRTNTAIVLAAFQYDTVVAVAGASITNNKLMEVGIDVLPAYRNHGLATAMIRKLTYEILDRGFVPFYSASITNIGSQIVATRAGYIPCWVDSWGNIFDNHFPYNLGSFVKE